MARINLQRLHLETSSDSAVDLVSVYGDLILPKNPLVGLAFLNDPKNTMSISIDLLKNHC